MASSKNNKYRKTIAIVTLFIAIGLITFGVWALFQRYRTTHNPNPTIPTETVTHSTDKPDETPPHCDDDYQVLLNEPRKIDIPSIGVSGCIQKVGIDQNNAIAVPTNIHLAGWYINSPLPGQKGVSIIDGHVMGQYTNAIFTNLEKLQPEDKIRIEQGDDSWHEFSVVDINNYNIDQASAKMSEALEGAEKQLTLITCGGNYDDNAQTYEERVIVRAILTDTGRLN